jgi:hypothetical protein
MESMAKVMSMLKIKFARIGYSIHIICRYPFKSLALVTGKFCLLFKSKLLVSKFAEMRRLLNGLHLIKI